MPYKRQVKPFYQVWFEKITKLNSHINRTGRGMVERRGKPARSQMCGRQILGHYKSMVSTSPQYRIDPDFKPSTASLIFDEHSKDFGYLLDPDVVEAHKTRLAAPHLVYVCFPWVHACNYVDLDGQLKQATVYVTALGYEFFDINPDTGVKDLRWVNHGWSLSCTLCGENRHCSHIEAAKLFRARQVYQLIADNYPEDTSSVLSGFGTATWTVDKKIQASLVLWLYDLVVENQAFLGQNREGVLYDEDVSLLLQLRGFQPDKLFQFLEDEQLLMREGNLFRRWEDVQNAYLVLFEKTGHKRYSSSDFGWWNCSSCGKSGDERSHASDYPCEVS